MGGNELILLVKWSVCDLISRPLLTFIFSGGQKISYKINQSILDYEENIIINVCGWEKKKILFVPRKASCILSVGIPLLTTGLKDELIQKVEGSTRPVSGSCSSTTTTPCRATDWAQRGLKVAQQDVAGGACQ